MKRTHRILTSSIAALLAGASAHAATLFYDGTSANVAGNGNGASAGGPGTWNTTILNWDAGASPHVAWSNSFADTATFGGTGAAVTVGGTVQVGTLNIASVNYIFNTGTIDFGSGGAGVLNLNNTNGAVMNALLSGVVKIQATGGTGTVVSATSVTINGNNTGLTSSELALNTDSNTIVINGAGALGAAGATVKLTKGVLNLGNNVGGDTVLNAWTTDLAGGTIRARFNNYTWTGAMSLSANTQIMTRNSAGVSFIGATTATINLNDKTLNVMAGNLTNGIVLNGVISGTGNLTTVNNPLGGTDNATGTTTLNAANTFSGTATTTLNLGSFALGNVNALQNATLNTGAAAGSQGVTFTVAGANTYNIGALAGSDALEIGGNTISVGAKAVDTAFAADISGVGGSLTKVGGNTLTLSAATSFSGATSVNNGTLALTSAGAVNSSTGITINGANAKLNASGATAVAPVVTLTQGTLTGSGSLGTVNVGAGTGGIISNNNGTSGAALTIGTLNLAGGAAINLFSDSIAAPLVVGALTNDSAANAITITANNPGGWTNGATYSLIGYTTLGGTGGNNFGHAVNNLSGRQSATWGNSGTAITLAIVGDNPFWTGAAADGKWNTTSTNWKLVSAGSPTQFLATDDVLFNDNATGTTTIDINAGNVAANTTIFNNTIAKDYTIGSSGGFGISSGSLTKNNNGKLTITNANSYAGGTTLNAGTLNVNHASALGAASSLFTINGGTLDNTLGSQVVTNNYPLSINGNFAFTGTNALNLGTGASTLGAAAGTSRTITVNGSTLTIGGAIANGATANSIVKEGAGVLVLSGASGFDGGVTLNAGTLRAESNAGALGLGALTAASGELQLAADSAIAFGRNTTLTGNVLFTSDTLTAVAGVTHTLGTLSIGANTLATAKGANATGTSAGIGFGATTFTGAPMFVLGANSTLTLGAVSNDVNDATFTGAGTFRQTGVWGFGAGGMTFDAGFTGTAVLSAANTFTGAVNINSGTVIAQANAALGSNLTGTTVASGGTLDLGGTLGLNALNLGTEVITVSGAGVGGNGALVNNGSNDQINATGRIVLAADATFGGTKRWDLRSNVPTLDMGGFTITKVGVNQVSLVAATVSNPGNIIINGGSLGIELATDLGGNAANNIVVNPTGTLIFFANTVAIPWTVLVNGATISQNNGSTTVSGAVVLGSGTNTINVAGTSLTFADVVTGQGFTKIGAGSLILNGPNDYTGTTTVSAGRVLVGNADGLGSPVGGTTVAANGILQLVGGISTNAGENVSLSGGGVDFFGALQGGAGGGTWQGNITLADNAVRLGATSGNTLTVTGSIADGAGSGLTISGQLGSGVVVLNPTTTNTYSGITNIVRGTLRIGKTNALPTGTVLDVDVAGGVPDAATFDLAGFDQEIAGLRDTATTNVTSVVTNSGATPSTLTINNAADFIYDGTIGANIIITKKGAGAQTLRGPLSFAALNQNEGRTNLNSALANAVITANGGRLDMNADANNSTVTVNDTATVNVTVSETLASLTINDGGTVVLGSPAPPAPPEFADGLSGATIQGVPEPGSAALIVGGMLTLLGMRRRRM